MMGGGFVDGYGWARVQCAYVAYKKVNENIDILITILETTVVIIRKFRVEVASVGLARSPNYVEEKLNQQ